MWQELLDSGKAIEIATENIENYSEKLTYLRDYYIKEIQRNIPFVKLNGHPYKRLPGNINMSFEGINGGTTVLLFAEEGIFCSSASACSTGEKTLSHVLKALGLPDNVAKGTIRLTLGEENNLDDIKNILKILQKIIERQRNW